MEIAQGIHQIKCVFGGTRMVFCYLLIGQRASMLVDTGCAHNPEQDILPYMQSIGFDPADLTYIVITHSDLDHQGGNQPMKDAAPNALLMCHNLDRAWIESADAIINGRYAQFGADHGISLSEEGKAGIRADMRLAPVDMTLEGGETFRLSEDWQVSAVHTPGHTWGHTAIYDPRSRTLISGEATMWTHIPNDDWTPAMPPTYCYVDTYIATQDRLMSMSIDLLASAHWPLQRGADVGAFIREGRNYCLHVEGQLLELAAQQSFTLREAIQQLAPNLGEWTPPDHQDFSFAMLGNLNALTKRGQLKTTRNDDGFIVWSLA